MTDHTFQDDSVIFSVRDGQVWAGRSDDRAAVRLGDHDAVLAVMRDFIRQSELGERLIRNGAKNRGA